MTFALWSLLVAAILPYACTAAAKFGGAGYDNAAPRASLDGLTGWRRRADWAQRNHFEAFGPYAAAVLTAHWAHAPQGRVDTLAAVFVVARVAYSVAYVANWAFLRSVLWSVGVLCMILLFCAAVL